MKDLFVSVGLIDMYSKCCLMKNAVTVYHLMPEKELVAINALISGLTQNGETREALTLFQEMHKERMEFNNATLLAVLNGVADSEATSICKQVHTLIMKSGYEADNIITNSLVDSYGKCSQVNDATRVFEECSSVDLPSYTSIMTTYAQHGRGEEALKLYLKLPERDIKPDSFVFSSLFNACANLSQIHFFAGNSLVNMYAKCGSIEDAGRTFSEIPERSVVSLSAMIGGLAQHGQGKEALDLFKGMLRDGAAPNYVTLVSVLSACNHAGLVDEAQQTFDTMEERYGIERAGALCFHD